MSFHSTDLPHFSQDLYPLYHYHVGNFLKAASTNTRHRGPNTCLGFCGEAEDHTIPRNPRNLTQILIDHPLGGLHNQQHFSNRIFCCRYMLQIHHYTEKTKRKKNPNINQSAESQNIAIYSTYHGNNIVRKSYDIIITANFIYL